jgi:hypothetical protein
MEAQPLSILTSDIEFQKIPDVQFSSTSFKLIFLADIANTLGQYITDIPARHMLVSWLAAIDILLVHAKPSNARGLSSTIFLCCAAAMPP